MKNLILILFVFIGYNSFAQRPIDNFLPKEIKYSAEDSVVTNANTNTIRLYGKATFEDDIVNFKADEIVIDKNTNKVVATGLVTLVFAPMVKSSVKSTNRKLMYTMGEKFIVIE